MKTLIKISFMIFLMVPVACTLRAQKVEQLSVQNFEKKLQETKSATVLDVRTASEYNQGHLANATLIDFYGADFKDQLGKLDKSKPVFVYCAKGGRSSSAAETLSDLGFKQIYDLQGGLTAWSQAKKPVVK